MLHLQKLSVGTETVEGLAEWQSTKRAQTEDGLPRHITRMWPKREAELLDGGSIFWVIKGVMLCRQHIVRLDEYWRDGIRYCAIVSDPELTRIAATPRRAFQGWRYLKSEDAPVDLTANQQTEVALPTELSKALADIGVR